MKRALVILLVAIIPVLTIFLYSNVNHQTVSAQSGTGPLYSAREKHETKPRVRSAARWNVALSPSRM